MLATIFLNRLKDAGAEGRLWPTQFGFRSGHSTEDAIFAARRVTEQAWARKGGQALLLALNWSKAFDSVTHRGLIQALVRFGVPQPMADMVSSLCHARRFFVDDSGVRSSWFCQGRGVCHGCPLMLFLLAILMATFIEDARARLGEHARDNLQPPCGPSELLRADDTLLLRTDSSAVSAYLGAVVSAGAVGGLELNRSQLELLWVTSPPRPDLLCGHFCEAAGSI